MMMGPPPPPPPDFTSARDKTSRSGSTSRSNNNVDDDDAHDDADYDDNPRTTQQQEEARQQPQQSQQNDKDEDSVISSSSSSRHYYSYNSKINNSTHDAFRKMSRVSRHAISTTKQAVWDSNELSIEAALSAVDQWEELYNLIRSFILQIVKHTRNLYLTAKEATGQLEHGFLIPVRDWILLPMFVGAEITVYETTKFCQSQKAQRCYEQSLQAISSVPVIGENVLLPTVLFATEAIHRTYQVLQYPIPSKEQVRDTVDWTLTTVKWALTVLCREVSLYAKRADANITRTLSHTQWKVLGSGPYATLEASNKSLVIDHICERYFAIPAPLARYELFAHIKRHNKVLFADLVLSDLLRGRGGDITEEDVWLEPHPIYHQPEVWCCNNAGFQEEDNEEDVPFLLPCKGSGASADLRNTNQNQERLLPQQQCYRQHQKVSALWFRQHQVNGNRPTKDAPWTCFRLQEQHALETKYVEVVKSQSIANSDTSDDRHSSDESSESRMVQDDNDDDENDIVDANSVAGGTGAGRPTVVDFGRTTADEAVAERTGAGAVVGMGTTPRKNNQRSAQGQQQPPPTIAQWYAPQPDVSDVMVDQRRHAVTFMACCPRCRCKHEIVSPPPLRPRRYGDLCETCIMEEERQQPDPVKEAQQEEEAAVTNSSSRSSPGADPFYPPPIATIMRPTFWRFYGMGDEVRRATWFLDTARNGLQPFDDEAQSVLEDAYFFLKWRSFQKSIDPQKIEKNVEEINGQVVGLDESLLTVEVTCPDGTERLVQFSSLTQATAIQKGLGAAIAIFKRRVYRGAWLMKREALQEVDESEAQRSVVTIDEAVADAAAAQVEEGSLLVGQSGVLPDVSIRSLLEPSVEPHEEDSAVLDADEPSLAVPPERLENSDMARQLKDARDGKIDHLCLIVHGIGEMLRSIDVFGLSLPNLSAVCGSMRTNHLEVQEAHFAQMYPGANKAARSAATGRVEYLPVEWHESFAIMTQRREPLSNRSVRGISNVMIKDISLRTIPNMREFANDTLMDVLFFMSPEHHDIIIDVVTHEMNLVVSKFRESTGFDGPISVIGHSLGSVISWDILNNQDNDIPGSSVRNVPSAESLAQYSTMSERSDTPEVTSPDVRVSQERAYPRLDFAVHNFFLLGSPVPVFLMIRNQRNPLSDDFYLRGCGRVFNIFHPYDPVAYRLEPCIDPGNADFEPSIIKHWNGGFRVQYRTRRLWRKLIETTAKTQRDVVEAFEQSMAGMGLLDATVDAGGDDDTVSEVSEAGATSCVVTGQLNQGRRIDYLLQEKEIENANEYVAALAAHSSYWIEKDLSLFIARQIYLSTLEYAAAEAEAAEHAAWETLTPEDMSNVLYTTGP